MDNNTTATVGGQTGQNATDNGNRTGQNSSDSTANNTNSTANNTGSTSAERTYTAAELEAEVNRRVNQAQLKWAAVRAQMPMQPLLLILSANYTDKKG